MYHFVYRALADGHDRVRHQSHHRRRVHRDGARQVVGRPASAFRHVQSAHRRRRRNRRLSNAVRCKYAQIHCNNRAAVGLGFVYRPPFSIYIYIAFGLGFYIYYFRLRTRDPNGQNGRKCINIKRAE